MNFAVYRTQREMEHVLQLIMKIITREGGQIVSSPEDALRVSVAQGSCAISVSVNREWAQFYSSLGKLLDCPWLFMMLQESSFWEYLLYRNDNVLDQFSTCPEQWGRPDQENEKWEGSASFLAREWGIDETQVERYLVNWDLGPVWVDILQSEQMGYRRRGKAYESDRWPYGCVDQAFDFVRTLGGADFASSKDIFARMSQS